MQHLRMMKVPLKQFYLEFCYSRTKYVRMYMYMYKFLMFDVGEQLVDDDGIKRYQGTNYYEFCANVSNSAPGSTTIRMKIVSTLDSELFLPNTYYLCLLHLSKLVLIS